MRLKFKENVNILGFITIAENAKYINTILCNNFACSNCECWKNGKCASILDIVIHNYNTYLILHDNQS